MYQVEGTIGILVRILSSKWTRKVQCSPTEHCVVTTHYSLLTFSRGSSRQHDGLSGDQLGPDYMNRAGPVSRAGVSLPR